MDKEILNKSSAVIDYMAEIMQERANGAKDAVAAINRHLGQHNNVVARIMWDDADASPQCFGNMRELAAENCTSYTESVGRVIDANSHRVLLAQTATRQGAAALISIPALSIRRLEILAVGASSHERVGALREELIETTKKCLKKNKLLNQLVDITNGKAPNNRKIAEIKRALKAR